MPYVFTALMVVPLLAPEYGEAATAIDDQVGKVSMGSQAAPYISNAASNIAQNFDNVLPCGSFGESAKKSKYKAAEKDSKYFPNIQNQLSETA